MLKHLTTADKKAVRTNVINLLNQCRDSKALQLNNELVNEIEQAVNNLPPQERLLITKRYLDIDSEYVTDQYIYNHVMEPAVSHRTFGKIRDRAMLKLAMRLNVNCGFNLEEKINC